MVLHRHEPRPSVAFRCAQCLGHLPRVPGAGADIAHLSLLHQVIERGECLLDGHAALEAMNLIEIDGFDAEAFQTRFASLYDVFAGQAAHVRSVAHREMDFGGEDDLLHRRHLTQGTPGYFFARAHRVHVCGVEEVDAEVERLSEERSRVSFIEHPRSPFRRAVAHAAETDSRNEQATLT